MKDRWLFLFNIGKGEYKQFHFIQDDFLAETFEAVVGAIYLDGGLLFLKGYLNNVLLLQ